MSESKLTSNTTQNDVATARTLFRRQAVEHVNARQYGTVVLARPVSYSFLTALFVLIALTVITFILLFETTRKSQCQGLLLPTLGVIRVIPGQSGIITEMRVSEGEFVRAGEVLFVLSGERSSVAAESSQKTVSDLLQSRRASFDAELGHLRAQAAQRIAVAERRASDLKGEIARLDSQINLQQQRVALAESAYKRYVELNATNYVSAAQLQDKQAELLDQRQRMSDLQRGRFTNQRDLAASYAEAKDLSIQAQRETEAIQRSVSVLDQDLTENEARRELLIRAPKDGIVTAISTDIGQTVAANANLASVLPAGAELEAEIYAPSRSVGFIKPGMAVKLRYEAYPYQKFGQYEARVIEVSNMSMRTDELTLPGSILGVTAEPVYRIRLKLEKQSVLAYGRQMPLKSGMRVEASILLEHRRLYEWILEPLFSISGRI